MQTPHRKALSSTPPRVWVLMTRRRGHAPSAHSIPSGNRTQDLLAEATVLPTLPPCPVDQWFCPKPTLPGSWLNVQNDQRALVVVMLDVKTPAQAGGSCTELGLIMLLRCSLIAHVGMQIHRCYSMKMLQEGDLGRSLCALWTQMLWS